MRWLAILFLSAISFAQGITIGPKVTSAAKSTVFAGTPVAGPSVVQSHIAVGSFATSTTIVFSSNVTSGNILVAWAFGGGTVTGWNAATGSGAGCSGTTFTIQGSPGTGSASLSVGTASGTGACTITVSGTGMADITGAAYEVNGGTTVGMILSAYGTVSCTTGCSGSALTTSTNNNLILTFLQSGSGPYSVPSPFAFDINATDGIGFSIGAGHFAQASSGTYTPTWNNNSAATNMPNVSLSIP